jgi:outer membrane protein
MTRPFNLLFAAIYFCITGLAAPAFAADVSLGLGGAWQSSPYKGHDDQVLPIPLVRVEWDRFYFNLFEAGAHIWKDTNQTVSLGVSYGGPSFDSDKTDDRALKRLDNRDAGLNAVVKYAFSGDYGHAGIQVRRDVTGESDAFSSEAFYKYPINLGSVHVSPGAGVQWDSEEQLGYYYGISPREARKSGLAEYKPDDGFSPFMSLETVWNLSDSWNVMASGKVLFLSEEVKDSPMVDAGEIFSAAAGLSYTF